MIVLGIDPGITNLGVGVVEQVGQKARLLHAEVVRTVHEDPAPKRVGQLYRAVYEVAAAFKPDAIAVEEQFFTARTNWLTRSDGTWKQCFW